MRARAATRRARAGAGARVIRDGMASRARRPVVERERRAESASSHDGVISQAPAARPGSARGDARPAPLRLVGDVDGARPSPGRLAHPFPLSGILDGLPLASASPRRPLDGAFFSLAPPSLAGRPLRPSEGSILHTHRYMSR